MKKLTAGIFASLLAVVATGAAHAEIASKGYVDDINKTLTSAIGTKADAADLDTKVDANAAITAGTGTKITYDAKGLVTGSSNLTAADIPALTTDKITGLDTELDSKASQTDLTALTGRVTTAEGDIDALQAPKAQVAEGVTGPVSGDTVFNAIEGVTGNVTGVTGRVDTLEGEMDTAQSDITELKTGKQDKLTGPVGSATQPVYVNAEGNVVAGTAYGSLATKSTVGTAEIEDDAVTTAKIGDGQVTAAKIATGVVPKVTTSIVAGNTDAAQAGAVATALAGKVDDADLSAYSTTQQMNTAISTATADMQTTTNMVKTIRDSATATDTQYPSEKAVATAIDTITTDAIEGLNLGDLATMDTVGSAQIDDGAVTQTKIGANAVGTTQIADGAVTTGKIADGTITDADISDTAEIAMKKIAGLEEALAGVIEKPEGCQGAGSDCVLVIKDGTIQWEDVARGASENSN